MLLCCKYFKIGRRNNACFAFCHKRTVTGLMHGVLAVLSVIFNITTKVIIHIEENRVLKASAINSKHICTLYQEIYFI